MGVGAKCHIIAGESRGMPGERMLVGAKCQVNAGECRGTYGCVQSARGMQGNARGKYWSVCKVPGECRGMPEECMGVCAKCHGNVGECSVMPR